MLKTRLCNRDWIEDYALENGIYYNKCQHCSLMFIGHKRRVICRLCHNSIKLPGNIQKDKVTTNAN